MWKDSNFSHRFFSHRGSLYVTGILKAYMWRADLNWSNSRKQLVKQELNVVAWVFVTDFNVESS